MHGIEDISKIGEKAIDLAMLHRVRPAIGELPSSVAPSPFDDDAVPDFFPMGRDVVWPSRQSLHRCA
jgi:hypothetical protein